MEERPDPPPQVADEWSNDQWIEWLNRTDEENSGLEAAAVVTPLARAARSRGGQALGGAMLGLAQAIYGPEERRPPLVVESAEPDPDDPLELHLDFEHPERSFVVLKPSVEPTE